MFADLSLHERLLKALAQLGFDAPTPVQRAALPLALSGRDLRVTAETGSGKTAAFLLPILHWLLEHPDRQAGTRALILVPTRELARQTLKHLEQLAAFTFIRGEVVTGGEDFKVQAARMRRNPELLIGTPGRLLEHLDAGNLDFSDVRTLVLDEADRMLDMGFKDDVMRLAALCPADRQTLLFSATTGGAALGQVVKDVLREPEHLQLNSARQVNPNVRQQRITCDDLGHKERLLRWLVQNEPFDKAIVFCNTREQADRLGGTLRTMLQKVYVLHGEKDHKERKLIMDRYRNGDIQVLVATDVAARGLDIGGLDLVINFDFPRSGDEYLHRAGRTGRIGREGLCISLVLPTEWNLMAGIQRYLRTEFEPRQVDAFPARFNGPKKLKASGKTVGLKKKDRKKQEERRRVKAREASRQKGARPSRPTTVETAQGEATVRRRGPAPAAPSAAGPARSRPTSGENPVPRNTPSARPARGPAQEDGVATEWSTSRPRSTSSGPVPAPRQAARRRPGAPATDGGFARPRRRRSDD